MKVCIEGDNLILDLVTEEIYSQFGIYHIRTPEETNFKAGDLNKHCEKGLRIVGLAHSPTTPTPQCQN
jgi:hypothetical protein